MSSSEKVTMYVGKEGTSLTKHMNTYEPHPGQGLGVYPPGVENTTLVTCLIFNWHTDTAHLGRYYTVTNPARMFDWSYGSNILAWSLHEGEHAGYSE